MNQSRIKTIVYSIYLSFFLVSIRLFYWQAIKSNELKRQLILQTYKTEKIIPKNGNIIDSFGNQLTVETPVYKVSLYKPNFKNLNEAVNLLTHSNINLDPSDLTILQKFISNPQSKWVTLNTKFNITDKQKIDTLPFNIEESYETSYPFGNFALNTLKSIRRYYQKQLTGKTGFSWVAKDALGQTILTKKTWINPPVDGRNINITINPIIQNRIEKLLKEGIEKYSADNGSIIVISPQTGAVLGLASFSSATSSSQLNPFITALYEPGSIFKPLVMTMALDSQSINSSYICTKCHQPRIVGEDTITNWDKSVHPNSSVYDIIKNSDNIGMSYIIDQLTLKKFLNYYHFLNLDRKTGIDISGEVKPYAKSYWSDIDFSTASFGQGLAVTQIEMISAFNTLANNGYWVKPFLAESKNPAFNTVKVFSPESVAEIKKILSYAVNNSPVNIFKPNNLDVCAKSGTAQVALHGAYTENDAIASYIGFAPCNNPKFTMLVTINNPKTSTWGSSTAAPIWYEIASSLEPLL